MRREVSTDLLDSILSLRRWEISPAIFLLNFLSVNVSVAVSTGDLTVTHWGALAALAIATLPAACLLLLLLLLLLFFEFLDEFVKFIDDLLFLVLYFLAGPAQIEPSSDIPHCLLYTSDAADE